MKKILKIAFGLLLVCSATTYQSCVKSDDFAQVQKDLDFVKNTSIPSLEAQSKQLSDALAKLQTAESALEATVKTLSDKESKDVENLNKQIADMKAVETKLQAAIDAINKDLQSNYATKEWVEKSFVTLDAFKDLEKIVGALKDVTIPGLEGRIAALEDKDVEISSKLNVLSDAVAGLQASVGEAFAQIEAVAKDLAENYYNKGVIDAKLDEIKGGVDKALADSCAVLEGKITEMEGKLIETMAIKIADAVAQSKDYTNAVRGEIETAYKAADAELNKKLDENIAALKEYTDVQLDAKQAMIEANSAAIMKVQADLASNVEKLTARIDSVANELTAEKDAREALGKALDDEIKAREEAIKEIQGQINDITGKLSVLEGKVSDLAARVTSISVLPSKDEEYVNSFMYVYDAKTKDTKTVTVGTLTMKFLVQPLAAVKGENGAKLDNFRILVKFGQSRTKAADSELGKEYSARPEISAIDTTTGVITFSAFIDEVPDANLAMYSALQFTGEDASGKYQQISQYAQVIEGQGLRQIGTNNAILRPTAVESVFDTVDFSSPIKFTPELIGYDECKDYSTKPFDGCKILIGVTENGVIVERIPVDSVKVKYGQNPVVAYAPNVSPTVTSNPAFTATNEGFQSTFSGNNKFDYQKQIDQEYNFNLTVRVNGYDESNPLTTVRKITKHVVNDTVIDTLQLAWSLDKLDLEELAANKGSFSREVLMKEMKMTSEFKTAYEFATGHSALMASHACDSSFARVINKDDDEAVVGFVDPGETPEPYESLGVKHIKFQKGAAAQVGQHYCQLENTANVFYFRMPYKVSGYPASKVTVENAFDKGEIFASATKDTTIALNGILKDFITKNKSVLLNGSYEEGKAIPDTVLHRAAIALLGCSSSQNINDITIVEDGTAKTVATVKGKLAANWTGGTTPDLSKAFTDKSEFTIPSGTLSAGKTYVATIPYQSNGVSYEFKVTFKTTVVEYTFAKTSLIKADTVHVSGYISDDATPKYLINETDLSQLLYIKDTVLARAEDLSKVYVTLDFEYEDETAFPAGATPAQVGKVSTDENPASLQKDSKNTILKTNKLNWNTYAGRIVKMTAKLCYKNGTKDIVLPGATDTKGVSVYFKTECPVEFNSAGKYEKDLILGQEVEIYLFNSAPSSTGGTDMMVIYGRGNDGKIDTNQNLLTGDGKTGASWWSNNPYLCNLIVEADKISAKVEGEDYPMVEGRDFVMDSTKPGYIKFLNTTTLGNWKITVPVFLQYYLDYLTKQQITKSAEINFTVKQ